ncbi:MAG TPA: tetratricopeptide repeat protein [Pyrinomonadaceae bacterium]|nr:tetratricopeptide repeat protein [Pyrinomonadaceae bacterium]
MKYRAIGLSILLVLSINVYAQTQSSPAMNAANALAQSGKWSEAAAAYEGVLKDEPKNANAWYQLGSARYRLKQYRESAAAFEKNVEIADNGFAMYNLACVYALTGDKVKALEWLGRSADNPTMVKPAINFADPDLAAIRDEPTFKAIAEKVDRTVHPCLYSDDAKQFDFFVGEWNAFNQLGRPVGSTVIQRIANGCGILENWRDAFGNEGKSINFYDTADKKWHQYWIGTNGVPLRYSGIYSDGAIRYEGEPTITGGVKTKTRLTFFKVDENTVRQLAENSSDDGKTWKIGYDFKYVRKK